MLEAVRVLTDGGAVEAEHVAVCGPSGGGKTTHLRKMHAMHDGPSVFLTTKKNEKKPEHRPPNRWAKIGASYPADIENARAYAHNQRETVQVIVDESHNAPSFQTGEGPLNNGLREDRSAGVKWVVATQNAQSWNVGTSKGDGYGLIQQCKYWVFVGPAMDWHRGFFNGNGMNDLLPHMPTENYEYVVVRPIASLSAEEKIVHRGRTDPAYS